MYTNNEILYNNPFGIMQFAKLNNHIIVIVSKSSKVQKLITISIICTYILLTLTYRLLNDALRNINFFINSAEATFYNKIQWTALHANMILLPPEIFFGN